MKKILKKTVLFLAIIFVIIQFFRPAKNNQATGDGSGNDISTLYTMPADVQLAFKTSCYDCHSNHTNYPWYTNIQPVGWWLENHINEGKRGLNFSEFASYRLRRQYKKLDDIIEEVKEGEMPLGSYTLIHRNAILSTEQKKAISEWADSARKIMEAKYPVDSLVKK